ncbi:hypothetical protein [Haloferula sargassicola]|uniref:Uncharacterized protein n=1 Tax=Haloferula sargassicola TaxID=490096 RepID=A0ABP9UY04_9BACT
MQTQVQPADPSELSTITDVIAALRAEGLQPKHESKNWGDWIHLRGSTTVISIESLRGLTGSATIELGEDEDDGPAILRAFHQLGWVGMDDEGEFSLA